MGLSFEYNKYYIYIFLLFPNFIFKRELRKGVKENSWTKKKIYQKKQTK